MIKIFSTCFRTPEKIYFYSIKMLGHNIPQRTMNEINKFPIPMAINFYSLFFFALVLNSTWVKREKKIAFRYAVCYPTSVRMQINAPSHLPVNDTYTRTTAAEKKTFRSGAKLLLKDTIYSNITTHVFT